jgi:hypothetical protein
MERVERHSAAPATSLLDALNATYRRIASVFAAGHAPHHGWGEDVAFSDELERELIRRELHAN